VRIFKKAQALIAFARFARDVNEIDRVFKLRDSGADPVYLARMRERLRKALPHGEAFLRDRVRLSVDRAALAALPLGTLGRAYSDFLRDNKLMPEVFPDREVVDESTFVTAHFYETHDLWHCVAGFGVDPAGEAGVQGMYAAQTFGVLPAALMSALLLNAAIKRDEVAMKARVDAIARGWSLGRRARSLIGYPWNDRFTHSLTDVRRELGIEGAALAA
jgi:ubiquinone biosynthesis protein Coq4